MVGKNIIILALLNEFVYDCRGNNTYVIQEKTALDLFTSLHIIQEFLISSDKSLMFQSFDIFFCLLHEQCLNIRFEFCFVWSKKHQLKYHTDFCLTGFCWYFFNFQVLLTVMHHRFEVRTYSYQLAFIVYLRTKT